MSRFIARGLRFALGILVCASVILLSGCLKMHAFVDVPAPPATSQGIEATK